MSLEVDLEDFLAEVVAPQMLAQGAQMLVYPVCCSEHVELSATLLTNFWTMFEAWRDEREDRLAAPPAGPPRWSPWPAPTIWDHEYALRKRYPLTHGSRNMPPSDEELYGTDSTDEPYQEIVRRFDAEWRNSC